MLAVFKVRLPVPDLVIDNAPTPPFCNNPEYVFADEVAIVSVAAPAALFSTIVVPIGYSELRTETVTLFSLSLKMPEALFAKLTAFGVVEFSAPAFPINTVPALIVSPPVKELFPDKDSVPALAVNPPENVLAAKNERARTADNRSSIG